MAIAISPRICNTITPPSQLARYRNMERALVAKLITMRTIDKIITNVNSRYGAPMGRCNIGGDLDNTETKVFDCAVPMSGDGAYDRGGAYWGIGAQLRVRYTKDLSYIRFYRRGEKWD